MKKNKYIYIIGKREQKWIEDFDKLCRNYISNHKNILIYNCYFKYLAYKN